MKYYLHYVASGKTGIYGKDIFIEEAKQIGVNRSLPYFFIKKLKWGDKILLANFEAGHTKERGLNSWNNEVSLKFQDGVANIFGYFVVSGLNLIASQALKERLYKQLDIISSNDTPKAVKRSCGSYVISASYFVTNELADIIEKAQKLAKEMKEKVKYFIGGNFYELEGVIEGINFSRSIIEVEFNGIEKIEEISQQVGFIQDYNKKSYIPKKERTQ
jgi:hypothetical protein